MKEIYKFADVVFEIDSIYETVHQLCEMYRTDESAMISFKINENDILYEKARSEAEDLKEGIPVRHFSDQYLETLAVYRKIAEHMVDFDTLLFHGSVIAVDGIGYLFTAKSGTGKSTHTALWRKRFGARAVMVNDDKPLLRISEDGVKVYGTPWDGKHKLSNNIAVPLKAICILERGEDNQIFPVSGAQVYPMLLQQTYRSTDPAKMMKILRLLDRMMNHIDLYTLACNMDPEAAQIAYEGMQGNMIRQEV